VNTYALILAAGKSSRLNSTKSKMLQPLLDRCVIEYVVSNVYKSNVDQIYLVVGHQKEQIKELLKDNVTYVEQKEQLGTADALLSAYEYLKDKSGNLIVTCGDMPLIDETILKKIIDSHISSDSDATILIGKVSNPKGLGRIITSDGRFIKIIEEKDASVEEKKINSINSGTYCFKIEVLFNYLFKLKNKHNNEFYLTDIFELLINDNKLVNVIEEDDETYLYGVNDFVELNRVSLALRRKINMNHCKNGVNIQDIDNTYIGKDVVIKSGASILPNTHKIGKTVVEENSVIGPNSQLNNATIGKNSIINASIIDSSTILDNCVIGPFSNIKQSSVISNNVIIGDFVEIKKSFIGEYCKAKHHAYIGDATINQKVNVGCGVIFANYDGKNKHPTIVKDNVFIGSNVTLVAPLVIEENAFIAAGSTITENIPQNALSIARQKQINKLEYRCKLMDKTS
jgi:bifunctional UDP-N-acetylglucosamine pyrophosphorylase/glucosamine-1-phosphate N-acetyltransferase